MIDEGSGIALSCATKLRRHRAPWPESLRLMSQGGVVTRIVIRYSSEERKIILDIPKRKFDMCVLLAQGLFRLPSRSSPT